MKSWRIRTNRRSGREVGPPRYLARSPLIEGAIRPLNAECVHPSHLVGACFLPIRLAQPVFRGGSESIPIVSRTCAVKEDDDSEYMTVK